MLPSSAEAAAQELMFKSLQNISLQLFVCVLFCLFSSLSLSLSPLIFCFVFMFCSVVFLSGFEPRTGCSGRQAVCVLLLG
jgi:hypothetical protein